jgi:hypothetical protein
VTTSAASPALICSNGHAEGPWLFVEGVEVCYTVRSVAPELVVSWDRNDFDGGRGLEDTDYLVCQAKGCGERVEIPYGVYPSWSE